MRKTSVKDAVKATPSDTGHKKTFKFPRPQNVSMISEQSDSRESLNQVFVDTCAQDDLFILRRRDIFTQFRKANHEVGCAALGTFMHINGIGSINKEENIFYCPDSKYNIVSQGRLHLWNIWYRCLPHGVPELMYGDCIVATVFLIALCPVLTCL